jgi:hypothetical protein
MKDVKPGRSLFTEDFSGAKRKVETLWVTSIVLSTLHIKSHLIVFPQPWKRTLTPPSFISQQGDGRARYHSSPIRL